jgi:hypothetical protein
MRQMRLSAAVLLVAAGFAVAADEKPVAQPPNPAEKFETTHKVVASIDVKGEKQGHTLQTICLDKEGRVVGLVGPGKPYDAPKKGGTSEVRLFDKAGKELKKIALDFNATAINVGPDGTIYAAGDSKIAAFDKDGKPVGTVAELPHLTEITKNASALKEKAEKQLKREKEVIAEVYVKGLKRVQERLKIIEDKKEENRTKTEIRQIEQFKKAIQLYELTIKDMESRTVEQVIEQLTGRMRVVNGMSVSEKDIFIACGDVGYDYAVWRFTKELKEPKQVLGELGGCCSQMDIQCHGPDVLVAENTKHQFARYDRDGKKMGAFGKRGDDADPKCFGGCCNPMNLRALATGDVYTAESEGIIKRFGPSGEFIETAGVVKLSGGCKNVAVAVSADAKNIYFCDLPGSKFHILEKKGK